MPPTHREYGGGTTPTNCRDRLLRSLHTHGLGTDAIAPLLVQDVATGDPDKTYLEARTTFTTTAAGPRIVPVTAELRACIEDYLNAAHSHGRPFLDYRPDIGVHLFPSARTGQGLNRRTISKILLPRSAKTTKRRRVTTTRRNPPPPPPKRLGPGGDQQQKAGNDDHDNDNDDSDDGDELATVHDGVAAVGPKTILDAIPAPRQDL